MRSLSRRVLAPLLMLLVASANAQEREVPPGATLKVLDIVFKVEDIGGQIADFQVKETGMEVRIELAADVLFEFDKATLQPAATDTLTKAAAIVRDKAAAHLRQGSGGQPVRIEGHTDSVGNDAYNQKLSERRADSVRQWFIRNGLGGVNFSSRGFGETKPAASNTRPDGSDDPEGRRKNRRVEIVIGKAG
jgi:outer membrane protein OmpA-like peptidoglycan-associated protein